LAYDLHCGNHLHMLSPAPVTFKANTLSQPLHRLSGASVLGIQGRDAAAFLQAQLMNDVAALASGRWQWNGWLNPKGRVIALFAVARIGEDEFLALLADFPAAELQQRLQRYVFRSKLILQAREDLACAGQFVEVPVAAPPARDLVSGDADAGWRLDMGGDGGARVLWLLPSTSPDLGPPDEYTDLRWREQDLSHGLPRLGPTQSEAWTPQMLSLERLQAFSLKKGCYPGQEIVARTFYLGKAKRGLARLRGAGLAAGASVQDEAGQDLGSIVCAQGEQALAVLAVERTGSGLNVNGLPQELLPLLDGLQRPL
jgi:folate-binding protein YgfZ